MTRTLPLVFTLQRIEAVLRPCWLALITLLLLPFLATGVFAHGVAEGDKLFIETCMLVWRQIDSPSGECTGHDCARFDVRFDGPLPEGNP